MKTIAASILLIASAAFVAAQNTPAAAPATPTVDQVISHYVDALGGKAAIEKCTTTYSKGTFEVPDFGVSGPFEQYEKAGDKTFMTIDIAGFGTVRRGFDGKTAWADDPQAGLRDLAGDEAAQAKRAAYYNSPLRMKDIYPDLAVKGSDKVNGKDAWVLEGTNGGSKERMYFDTESGLLVREDGEVTTPDGSKGTSVTYIQDYKPVDGVQEPFTITNSGPQMSFNVKRDSVTHNVAIDDAKFAKPAPEAPAPAPSPAPVPAPAEGTPAK